jgi:DUF971 family protein
LENNKEFVMLEYKLNAIKKLNKFLISSVWSDSFTAVVKMNDLRNNCPCAECQEKRIENERKVIELKVVRKGEFLLDKIIPAGNYALNFEWADGHNLGYYPWQLLREIFEKYKLNETEINNLINK